MFSKTKKKDSFHFKQFTILQDLCPMKVNTDGVLLGAWSEVCGMKTILEIGTGTGVISLMLAQKNHDALIDAIDIDENACFQAKMNFQQSTLGHNITCHHQRFQDFACHRHEDYDLVVSNPPFFTEGPPSPKTRKALTRHAIQLSHEELLVGVKTVLKESGYFDIILPAKEGEIFSNLSPQYGLYIIQAVDVVPRIGKPVERLLMRFSKKKPLSIKTESLIIMKENTTSYTDEFIHLTRDYYLNL